MNSCRPPVFCRRYRRSALAIFVSLSIPAWLVGCGDGDRSVADETRLVEQWRAKRFAGLTGEDGWLTLAGLYWLHEGENRFGRAAGNAVILDHPALQDVSGVFTLRDGQVRFTAAADSNITSRNQPVTQIDLQTDASGDPTILQTGSLRFYAIQRAGKFGVRVRDIDSPARNAFHGLQYFPIDMHWRIRAHFEPYVPSKRVPIVNILGMVDAMESPGALVFDKDGKTWRLDTILESPGDSELFVMFTDTTGGRETYGAGRYLYVAKPVNDIVWLDFNQAYNPPCAFTEFATCPLPPRQNRLPLAITAGEKKYTEQP